MSDNKKYYYLKLKDNFFDTDAMIILENMQDGHLYSNILLKLYLRSLKNEGKLMFNDFIPYNSNVLAQVTRHPVGVIEKALQTFKKLGLVDILDNGAIYMLDIQNYIGASTSEADRKRLYRSRIDAEKGNVMIEGDICPDKRADINPPKKKMKVSRFSIPFFMHPRSDMDLTCLDSCVDADNPKLFEDMTAGEFLDERLKELGLNIFRRV